MKKKWEEKKVNLGSAIVVAGAISIACFVIGINFTNWFSGFAPYLGMSQQSEIDWSPLNEVYNKLASSYDGEISKTDVIEGAKKGLTAALGDIYTVYMDQQTATDYTDSLHGNVGAGIGVEMGKRDGYVRILRTMPDNPAKKAGILAGDIIYKVDGEEVYTLSADEISSKIRGEVGTEVTVTIVRDSSEKTFTMKREVINNVSAYIEYEKNTAIITITRFDTDTGTIVKNFTKDFEEKGVNKVILDLRDNGGGYVSAAQDLLALWLDGKDILIQKSKHFGTTVTKTDSGKAALENTKTIILVNGSTASASEIVVGALQDYEKATVVGETTYGKGVVQNMYNLSGGTILKVTTASWYTPLDRTINGEGITPDIEVVRSYDDINAMRDPQMKKAKEL